MKILAKSNSNNNQYYNIRNLPSKVIELGKYLEKNLEGASVPKHQPVNAYVIYDTILYTINESVQREISEHIRQLKELYAPYEMPKEVRREVEESEKKLQEIKSKIYEMSIYLHITTYRQYIRVNVIQHEAPDKKPTLGFLRLEPEELISMPHCKDKIVRFVKKSVEKYYAKQGYEVLV
jgi:CRISPR/Cas system CSM-associated protein Csm2 small subunit